MRPLLALAGLLALSACSAAMPLLDQARPLPASGAAYDGGGLMAQRIAHIRALQRSGQPFVAPRECLSACTLYLALPTACFPRDGTLGFHSAAPTPGVPGSAADGNMIAAAFYAAASPRLARWFLDGPARSDALVMVPAAELIERGEARPC